MKAAENPHHLGSGDMLPSWQNGWLEEEERRVAGLPALFEGMDERSRNFFVLAGTHPPAHSVMVGKVYQRRRKSGG
jgi:hypothetical protein